MIQRIQDMIWLTIASIALAFAIVFAIALSFADARDLGQWEQQDPEIRLWFQSLRQPDNPDISCCGFADAYYADKVVVEDGVTYAIITDTRDDAELRRLHIDVGTRIEIPPNKFGPGKWGNPTGHTVIFVGPGLHVYCYVQGTGS